jgi:hypothetical protein
MNPVRLTVRGRPHPQIHVISGCLLNRHRIRTAILWAVYEEDVDLSDVTALRRAARVRLNAPRCEADNPIPQAPGFALRADELAIDIKDKVVTLVDPEGQKDAIAAADQVVQDGGLGSQSDIDGMSAEPACLFS